MTSPLDLLYVVDNRYFFGCRNFNSGSFFPGVFRYSADSLSTSSFDNTNKAATVSTRPNLRYIRQIETDGDIQEGKLNLYLYLN